MNEYRAMKKRHQKEYNRFAATHTFAAFSKDQFNAGMKKLGIADPSEVVHVVGGVYVRRTDKEAMMDLFKRQNDEIRQSVYEDRTGEGFALDMFLEEFANHETLYTGDVGEALSAIPFTTKEIQNSTSILHAFNKALEQAAEED